MKQRLALIFPYLCALIVVISLVWKNWDLPLAVHKDPVCHMEVGETIACTLNSVNIPNRTSKPRTCPPACTPCSASRDGSTTAASDFS